MSMEIATLKVELSVMENQVCFLFYKEIIDKKKKEVLDKESQWKNVVNQKEIEIENLTKKCKEIMTSKEALLITPPAASPLRLDNLIMVNFTLFYLQF